MSTESEEDDNFATEAANQSIIDALGVDKRNKILAGLYIGRSAFSKIPLYIVLEQYIVYYCE